MSKPDPLDQLLRAAELRQQLDGLPADQVDLRLQQHQDLRELVEPLLARSCDGSEPLERVIGDFRLVRELGRGGMGIVYEAWQLSLNRRVALKLLSPALGSDPASIARFHREATLAAGLSHPSLASVYGFQAESSGHCLILEYIDGVPADKVLAKLRQHGLASDPQAKVRELGIDVNDASYEAFAAPHRGANRGRAATRSRRRRDSPRR